MHENEIYIHRLSPAGWFVLLSPLFLCVHLKVKSYLPRRQPDELFLEGAANSGKCPRPA
ncbi:hypothetical protein WN55_03491 [Dufourea novaeangliae]|uniref:Uncharacterized protein n=1 Tax=Dufourea novaeangliae TaxID=178035 RepID=A0A154PJC1_DUFNO|nr:hypothetical protein WN55_03491 [Dufourea novaeangliae]